MTRDLVGSAGIRFEDRGEHSFKGFDTPRRLFALAELGVDGGDWPGIA